MEYLLQSKGPSDEETLLTNYATDFPTRTFLVGMLASGIYTVVLSNLEDEYWRYYIPILNIASFVLIACGIAYSWTSASTVDSKAADPKKKQEEGGGGSTNAASK